MIPFITSRIRTLALDIRPRSISAVVSVKHGHTLSIERAVTIATIDRPTEAIGKALVRELRAVNIPTVASIDAMHVITTSIELEPYIQERDFDGLAKRHAAREHRPTPKARRTRWRKSGQHRLTLSVADQAAVEDTAALLKAWGCKPWIIADPSIVWLETLAPSGIIDDLEGTTLFATPGTDGAIHNDIISNIPDPTQFTTAALSIIRAELLKSRIEKLTYFGPATRYTKLRETLFGLGIELVPAVPPNHDSTTPWTYALALAAYGAAS